MEKRIIHSVSSKKKDTRTTRTAVRSSSIRKRPTAIFLPSADISCHPAGKEEDVDATGESLPTLTAGGGESGAGVESGGRGGGGGRPVRPGFVWQIGKRLEAKDFMNIWYSAKIVDIDDSDRTVLIHFDGWNQRYDEWVEMDSDRLRPMTRHSDRSKSSTKKTVVRKSEQQQQQKPLIYKVGENIFARWTDCRMYPGKIIGVNRNGSYEVLFEDGFKKTVQSINIDTKPPNPLHVMHSSPLSSHSSTALGEETIIPPDSARKHQRQMMMPGTSKVSFSPDGGGGVLSSVEKLRDLNKKKLVGCSVRVKRCFSNASEEDDVSCRKRCTSDDANDNDDKLSPADCQQQQQPHMPENEDEAEEVKGTSDGGANVKRRLIHAKTLYGKLKKPSPGGAIQPPASPDYSSTEAELQLRCPHPDCNKVFRNSNLVQYHLKYYHPEDKSAADGSHSPLLNLSASHERKRSKAAVSSNKSLDRLRLTRGKRHRNIAAKKKQQQQRSSMRTESTPSMQKVVNCSCDGSRPSSPLIQCSVCLCWQHEQCTAEEDNPITFTKTYICKTCTNPSRLRESARYSFDQDWLVEGRLAQYGLSGWTTPTVAATAVEPKNEEEEVEDKSLGSGKAKIMKLTHQLMADLHGIQQAADSINRCIFVVKEKVEPELSHWIESTMNEANTEETQKQEEEEVELKVAATTMRSNSIKSQGSQCTRNRLFPKMSENRKNSKDGDGVAEIEEEEEEEELEDNKGMERRQKKAALVPSALLSANNSDKHHSSNDQDGRATLPENERRQSCDNTEANTVGDRSCSIDDLDRGITSVDDRGGKADDTGVDSSTDKCNLEALAHISHMQDAVEQSLNIIREQVTALENGEGNGNCSGGLLKDLPRVKKTLNQLMTDLDRLQLMSLLSHSPTAAAAPVN